jgi:hypothetical protein
MQEFLGQGKDCWWVALGLCGFFFFCGAGVWTWGLVFAKQALCYLSPPPVHFALSILEMESHKLLTRAGLALQSSFQVARIIGVSHQHSAFWLGSHLYPGMAPNHDLPIHAYNNWDDRHMPSHPVHKIPDRISWGFFFRLGWPQTTILPISTSQEASSQEKDIFFLLCFAPL